MTSQPVLLCGKTEQIATGVIAGLKPEYDVIHLVLTPEGGIAQIPLILRGAGAKAASDSSLGTHDYARTPIAVITGAGYDDEMIERMMGACEGDAHVRQVPWLRPDTTKPAPPLGPEYGKALVQRVKDTIAQLQSEKKMDTEKVVYY